MQQPSNQEMTILALLWREGELSARQVLEMMPDQKERAYTSILSVMQAMEKKGLLGHRKDGRCNVYHPIVKKNQIVPSFLNRLVNNLFGGNKAQLMQQLLADDELSTAEIESLRQMVDAHDSPESKEK